MMHHLYIIMENFNGSIGGQMLIMSMYRSILVQKLYHGTGKTGNLDVNFSRWGKHREFS